MNTLEVISKDGIAEVPIADTARELIDGLRSVVSEGVVGEFNDVAWLHYFGPFEKMEVQSDPDFHALLQHIESLGIRPEAKDMSHLDVLASPDNLVTKMAAISGNGGGFWRVSSLDEQRYVAVPATLIPDVSGQTQDVVTMDITHGLTFAGTALTEALFNSGIMAEIIDYRNEPAFPAYREATLGRFFVEHALI